MKKELVQHLRSLHPALGVEGGWAFFGNAKTAQKSMGWMVLRYTAIHYWRGTRNWNRVWDHLYADNLDNVFRFTFVRNPWERVVSAFFFLQQRGEISQHITFSDYVMAILAVKGTGVNIHFAPQSPTILFEGQLIPGQFIGRYEHLERDWAYVAGRIGLPSSILPHHNRSTHDNYITYYDDASREIVAGLYAEEIKELGYEFGH